MRATTWVPILLLSAGCVGVGVDQESGGTGIDWFEEAPEPTTSCWDPQVVGTMVGDPFCPGIGSWDNWGDSRCSLPIEERGEDLRVDGSGEAWLAFDVTEARWGAIQDLVAWAQVDGPEGIRVAVRFEGECELDKNDCGPDFSLSLVRQFTPTATRASTMDVPAYDDGRRILVHVWPSDPTDPWAADWWTLRISSFRPAGVPLDPELSACEP